MNVMSLSYDELINEISNLSIYDCLKLPASLSATRRELIILFVELYNEIYDESMWDRITCDMINIDRLELDYILSKIDLGIVLKIQPNNLLKILNIIDTLPLFKSRLVNTDLRSINHLTPYTLDNENLINRLVKNR